MRFANLDHYFTGVSVPVAALRTAKSCGVGEFSDLPDLGRLCRQAGLEVIQVLPVNDTGGNASPYSALSAFALHPLYIRLQDVPGTGRFDREIRDFMRSAAAREAASGGRFSYRETLGFKLSILERAFADRYDEIRADSGFARWMTANPWVVPYAVFTALRKENREMPWASWPALSDPSDAEIDAWGKAHMRQCLLPAWVQFLLEGQLASASRALAGMGVFLKGDLPILMSEESADVWASREYFDLSARAGAPPDMFSPDGQNWGFPVYDWERMAGDGYRWWKARLRQAAKLFHAFRIDHVLGFFRIWSIPRGETTGLLGRFAPSSGLSRRDLADLGFDDGRIRWLSVPHIGGDELAAGLGAEAGRAAGIYLDRMGNEELYTLKPTFDRESAIHSLREQPEVKSSLLAWHANRALVDVGMGTFFPAWYLERTKGFQTLVPAEKTRLSELLGRRRRESEETWEKRGRQLLAMLRETTDMLVCAEDLGDVPDCVPRVLADLEILGLRIVRWSRDWKASGPGSPAPFIPPARYPSLSVCTPSVHDTSTIRGWWEEDQGERELFFRTLDLAGPCPPRLTRDLLELILARCLGAGSLLCMFQMQDLLDLDVELWSPDPRADRINVPGTIADTNWTWRMPAPIDELAARPALSDGLKALVRGRRERPLREGG